MNKYYSRREFVKKNSMTSLGTNVLICALSNLDI